MGALLSLYLAAKVTGIQGILSYAPIIKASDRRQFLAPVVKIFKRTVKKSSDQAPDREMDAIRWAYDVYPTRAAHELLKLQVEVKRLLPDIAAPLLIIYSTADERIKTDGIDLLLKKVESSEKEVVKLKQSGHIITLDVEWEVVAQKSLQFIDKHR
jgi:carboxylesterase